MKRLAILGLCCAAVLVGCESGGVSSSTNGADRALDGDLIQLPDDHPAALILATGSTYEEFSEAATEQDLRFVCAEDGIWQACVVLGDDVLAVVPFDVPSGLIGTIESGSLDDAVSLPLDRGATGIAGVDMSVTLTLKLDGETVGSISGP